MLPKAVVVLALCGSLVLIHASEFKTPHVLMTKEFSSAAIVENKESVIVYTIYNIGNGTAYDLHLTDDGPSHVSRGALLEVSGEPNVHWSWLSPGANLTHSVVIKPLSTIKELGDDLLSNFRQTIAVPAKLSYKESMKSRQLTAHSTAPRVPWFYSSAHYERLYGHHLDIWAHFALVVAVLCALPVYKVLEIRERYPSSIEG